MFVSHLLTIPITTVFSVIDFGGVFAGALGGAFAARENKRYQYDFVGVMGLALISALGGGVARDVLLNHGPPLALVDTRYLLVAMVGGALGLTVSHKRAWLRRALVGVDALALGLFAVAGSARALAAGLSFLPALLLGVTTAVGGGSLRDVFSGRTPQVFERGEPYAIVAAAASVVFLTAEHWLGLGTAATALAVASSFILRLATMRFRWKTHLAR
ncbi:putative membrane protein YeiH [Granulicella aggregans]|jgi:uncharacterized membrane protein YeiH|uniref:Putative membrane protein YeiH n=1 Tax=Granulicella aggregans TaxID=474949 RepID=A0A7W7ZG55_9BACT|nr:TRIC cation channel family protein [Granulicella aggregans]MBB5059334.1 putative membrane protein YeiH [Granulicella aggregans]